MSKQSTSRAKASRTTVVETEPHTPYTDILMLYDVARRNFIKRWLTIISLIIFMIWFPTARDNLQRFEQVCHTNLQPHLIKQYGCADPLKCDQNHSVLTVTSETRMIALFDICEGRSKHYHERIADWYRARDKRITNALIVEDKVRACEEELKANATAELNDEAINKISAVCHDRFNDVSSSS